MRGVHWMWIGAVVQGFVLATPLAGLQFCGRDLANAMSIVCRDRGYNMAFRPDPSGDLSRTRRDAESRIKRGIVDECCRAGCSWSTLEAYCKPASTTPGPSNSLQIRKRSDLTKNWGDDSDEVQDSNGKFSYVTDHLSNRENIEIRKENTRDHKRKLFIEEKKGGGRYFGYRNPKEQISSGNKVKRNYIHDIIKSSSKEKYDEVHPLIRHHRERMSVEKRHKRLKETPQVGTISPYFLGRTLVSPTSRKSLIPHY